MTQQCSSGSHSWASLAATGNVHSVPWGPVIPKLKKKDLGSVGHWLVIMLIEWRVGDTRKRKRDPQLVSTDDQADNKTHTTRDKECLLCSQLKFLGITGKPIRKLDLLWWSQERWLTQSFYFVELVREGEEFCFQGLVWFQPLINIWEETQHFF